MQAELTSSSTLTYRSLTITLTPAVAPAGEVAGGWPMQHGERFLQLQNSHRWTCACMSMRPPNQETSSIYSIAMTGNAGQVCGVDMAMQCRCSSSNRRKKNAEAAVVPKFPHEQADGWMD